MAATSIPARGVAGVRLRPIAPEDADAAARIVYEAFAGIHDHELVRDHELAAGEIAAHFDVTRPAISQHLTVLKDAGLLAERRVGTHRLYRADGAGLLGLKQFVDRFGESGSTGSRTRRRPSGIGAGQAEAWRSRATASSTSS